MLFHMTVRSEHHSILVCSTAHHFFLDHLTEVHPVIWMTCRILMVQYTAVVYTVKLSSYAVVTTTIRLQNSTAVRLIIKGH